MLLLQDDDDDDTARRSIRRKFREGVEEKRDAGIARREESWCGPLVEEGAAGRGERHGGTEGGPQDQVRGKGSPSRVPYIYNRGAFRVK